MTKIKLSKISGGKNIRTQEVIGEWTNEPLEIGKVVELISTPLTEGADIRLVNTSPLKDVDIFEAFYILHTISGSQYKMEIIK